MPPTDVQYFFSFASPFAALADSRIDDLVEKAGANLVPIPVVPPQADPPTGLAAQVQEFRVSYVIEDSARWAKRLGLHWNPAPRAPGQGAVDTTDASAGWYFARDRGKERAYRNAVFVARFGEARDITDLEVLADCAEKAGLSRTEFREAIDKKLHHDEVPKALVLCMQEKVFGVPLFVVHGKRFWGNDRIDSLLDEIEGA
jgi:2-hydroxychromene-2-carboxylate isomerase